MIFCFFHLLSSTLVSTSPNHRVVGDSAAGHLDARYRKQRQLPRHLRPGGPDHALSVADSTRFCPAGPATPLPGAASRGCANPSYARPKYARPSHVCPGGHSVPLVPSPSVTIHTHITTCIKLVCAYKFYEKFQKMLFCTHFLRVLSILIDINQHNFWAEKQQLGFLTN